MPASGLEVFVKRGHCILKLETIQNLGESREISCERVHFLIKLQARRMKRR